jgi:hypothetical protein
MGKRRTASAGVRRMISVLRRKCYVPLAGLLASKCTRLQVLSLLLPRLQNRVDHGDSSSFTVAGPHRDCTGLPFSALSGTLGLQLLYHANLYFGLQFDSRESGRRYGLVPSASSTRLSFRWLYGRPRPSRTGWIRSPPPQSSWSAQLANYESAH